MRTIAPLLSAVAVAAAVVMTGCGGGGGGGGEASPTPTPSNPIYVRVSGNDANTGADPANALQHIRTAASRARNGYKIIVGPGSYHEEVTTAAAGEAPRGVQFVADVSGALTGDHADRVTLSPGSGDVAGFNLFSSAAAIIKGNMVPSVIDGFTITGFSDAGIVLKSGSDDFIIQNCIIFDNSGEGIRVQDSINVLVFNNLIYGNGGIGIGVVGTISGSDGSQLISNTIADNGNRGITIGNSTKASGNAVVHNNILQGNGGDANIKVFPPPSDQTNDVDYNLVSPPSYVPAGIEGSHDIGADAQFASATDFHLQPTSPAIDAGGALNLPNSQTTILRARTTTGNGLDRGVFDMGFHFLAK